MEHAALDKTQVVELKLPLPERMDQVTVPVGELVVPDVASDTVAVQVTLTPTTTPELPQLALVDDARTEALKERSLVDPV